MSDAQNNGTLVGAKRVRTGTDNAGRKKTVLTFGLDKNGNNSADQLLAALETLRGKQVNFDIRVGEKESANGTFETAFVIIKEMVPKDQQTSSGGQAKFVPKNKSRAENVKATAQKIREQMED